MPINEIVALSLTALSLIYILGLLTYLSTKEIKQQRILRDTQIKFYNAVVKRCNDEQK